MMQIMTEVLCLAVRYLCIFPVNQQHQHTQEADVPNSVLVPRGFLGRSIVTAYLRPIEWVKKKTIPIQAFRVPGG
jgi:hypothetical protein